MATAPIPRPKGNHGDPLPLDTGGGGSVVFAVPPPVGGGCPLVAIDGVLGGVTGVVWKSVPGGTGGV
jgi:hypothetical protein